MKSLFFLLLGFLVLFGSPTQAMDFDNDVGVEYVLSVENDCIDNTRIASQPLAIVGVLMSNPVEEGLSINTLDVRLISEPPQALIYNHSQEVGFIDTDYLFMCMTNSNETIREIPDVSNVNVHFGSINEFHVCFMSANSNS